MNGRPFAFVFMEWLENVCPAHNLITPSLEWLEPSGVSSCVVQTSEPTVKKSYINGSKQYQTGFEIVAQGNKEDRLTLIQNISGYISLILALRGNEIESGIEIVSTETTTPSLRAQTENGIVRYGTSVTIVYKEYK